MVASIANLQRILFCMRKWTLELLQCLNCKGQDLRESSHGIVCSGCAMVYKDKQGITDFMHNTHPTVAKERDAVESLSDHPEAVAELREYLVQFDQGTLGSGAYRKFECLAHAEETRSQIQEVLKKFPVAGNETVLEIGADHCWTSNLLLDAGCRVIASDVTAHLQLASRCDDPNLDRIYSDMNALPIRDRSVDVVWATSAIHHSWDLAATFRETARILRPGGRVYFCCEPIPSLFRYFTSSDFGHKERELGINETWIRRGVWLKLCREAGLQPELVFPDLQEDLVRQKLRSRGLPSSVAVLARLFRRQLQVSIHLLARKPASV